MVSIFFWHCDCNSSPMVEKLIEKKNNLIEDSQHYVRVTNVLHNKFVEFEYSIGDPTLCVELVLPFPAFEIFRARHRAKNLTPVQEAAVDFDRMKWRYGKPGVTE